MAKSQTKVSDGDSHRCRLQAPGWNETTRRSLEHLITRGANQRLPVVFDFDNTLVCGDIGEATLAMLARSGVLSPRTVPTHLCPPFRLPGQRLVRMDSCADVTQYYEALLDPTIHGPTDQSPLANGYTWAVQVMEGLRLPEVVKATRDAFAWSDPRTPGQLEVTPGRTAYPVPFFYPEMVELVFELVRHRFDIWIVSASNVWTVRWMVLNALNPLLRKRGARAGLRADHVLGVSTLLSDRKGHLYKDAVLVRENEAYARMDLAALGEFRLTNQLQFPAPTYSGKIAAVFDAIGRNPYLTAGDSPGDLPMMAVSRHRLWIARAKKRSYQQAMTECVQRTGGVGWLVQPTVAELGKGFVSGDGQLR